MGWILATKGIKNIKEEYSHLPIENILSAVVILAIIGIMYIGNYLLGILCIFLLLYVTVKDYTDA